MTTPSEMKPEENNRHQRNSTRNKRAVIPKDPRPKAQGSFSPTQDASTSQPLITLQPPVTEGGATTVIGSGRRDVVLEVKHEFVTRIASHSFAVDSSALQQAGPYFNRLLSPGRFGEGERIQSTHEELTKTHGADWRNSVSLDLLPIVKIEDLGRVAKVSSIVPLLADFLSVLIGMNMSNPQPPVANLANLAIVADRFGALEILKEHVQRRKLVRLLDSKTTPKVESALIEEKVRQRLLVGILLDYPPWVERYSGRLLIKGWVGREAEIESPLWWDIPGRIEDEISFRRERVLETIESLQNYFLNFYLSRSRQCKLGYHNSGECDSFQLGEMIKFFHRIGTLELRALISDDGEDSPSSTTSRGDLNAFIDTFRQIPEYQIDPNHNHCGLRTRVVPQLDVIQECLHSIGICGKCWREDRVGCSWLEAKRPLGWYKANFRLRSDGCQHRHSLIRDMFMSTERHWE